MHSKMRCSARADFGNEGGAIVGLLPFFLRNRRNGVGRIRVFCLLCVWLSVGTVSTAEMLRVGVEENYPPFSYVAAGKNVGFDVDLSRALCRELGRPCTLSFLSLGDCLPALVEGRVDMVVAGLSKTPERLAMADFTDAYYRAQSSFIGRAGVFYADTGIQALAGKRIAAEKHSMQEQFVLRTYGPDALVSCSAVTDALAALASGKADLVLTDVLIGLFFLKSPAGSGYDFASDALSEEGLASSAHILVRKGNTPLIRHLNAALSALRYSGKMDQISRAYFPFSIY